MIGIRQWLRYIKIAYGDTKAEQYAFPPRLQDILDWSNIFQCHGTFDSYLGCLRVACHAIWCGAPPVGHPALFRAIVAVVKRELFQARKRMCIDRAMVCNMVVSVQ